MARWLLSGRGVALQARLTGSWWSQLGKWLASFWKNHEYWLMIASTALARLADTATSIVSDTPSQSHI